MKIKPTVHEHAHHATVLRPLPDCAVVATPGQLAFTAQEGAAGREAPRLCPHVLVGRVLLREPPVGVQFLWTFSNYFYLNIPWPDFTG